jgi:transposase
MQIQFEELLNLAQVEVEEVMIETTTIHIHIHSKLEISYCPHCLGKNEQVNQSHLRQIRDLPLMGKKVILHLKSRQFICPSCKRYYHERFDFVEPSETVTKRYSESVFKLCNGIELQHIVVIEDLCWQTVNRIFCKFGSKLINKADKKREVKRIGIDEIALKKGHKNYIAVVVDLDTGTVLDLLEDRSKEFIISYFEKKGKAFCDQIILFCSDLWEGYLNAAKSVFPNASIVTDRFHFFAKLQASLDMCRKYYRKKYGDDKDLVNLKWILLKNEFDLNKEEKILLKRVFAKKEYHFLRQAYEQKNKFREILEEDISKAEAEEKIEKWLEKSETNRFLNSFVVFYKRWKAYILNYFQGRYHTSLIEGINNKIKSIKRRAFGFMNFESFRIRVITAFL